MAKKKKTELDKNLSAVELQAMSESLGREVFDLRNTLSMQRKLEKPHLLKAKRKERARVLTLLTQKQKQGATV
jgi:large subunit ribosomal protein L29